MTSSRPPGGTPSNVLMMSQLINLSRELSQILHLDRKAEIQCILGSSKDSQDQQSLHLDRVLSNIFWEDNPSADDATTHSTGRGAAAGLMEYVVDRMSELRSMSGEADLTIY